MKSMYEVQQAIKEQTFPNEDKVFRRELAIAVSQKSNLSGGLLLLMCHVTKSRSQDTGCSYSDRKCGCESSQDGQLLDYI
jgi:hypothetical protein